VRCAVPDHEAATADHEGVAGFEYGRGREIAGALSGLHGPKRVVERAFTMCALARISRIAFARALRRGATVGAHVVRRCPDRMGKQAQPEKQCRADQPSTLVHANLLRQVRVSGWPRRNHIFDWGLLNKHSTSAVVNSPVQRLWSQ